MPIQILPPQLANQIAAGEVVERPASVVKELVENSLDAGADRVDIELDKGGHKRICIRDNGKGIEKSELSLALSRHATSKIASIDDLESIMSLGFRGEALASISSVSRLTLTSKPESQPEAWMARAEGRDMNVSVMPAAHPKGTSVEVLDLFFNTPARRKFLRAEKTEFGHVDETIRRIALSRYDVTFTLKHNGKMIRRYPAVGKVENHSKRIASICGEDFCQQALQIESRYQDMHITGWMGAPALQRSHGDLQYFYVNGRMMRDKLINHAVRQAYEGLLGPEMYPSYVLYLTLDPEHVDVNVHPAKHEVRFHQARLVHDFVFRVLTDALNQSVEKDAVTGEHQVAEPEPFQQPQHGYIRPLRLDTGDTSDASALPRKQQAGTCMPNHIGRSSAVNKSAAGHYQQLMQVPQNEHTQDGDSNGMTVLHVDREMLLLHKSGSFYKVTRRDLEARRIKRQFSVGIPVAQPLLMPVSVQATNAQLERAKSLQEALQNLSIDIGWASGRLLIRKVPAGFRHYDWSAVLTKLLEISTEELENQSVEYHIQHLLADAASHCDVGEAWQAYIEAHGMDWTPDLNGLATEVPLRSWLVDYDGK